MSRLSPLLILIGLFLPTVLTTESAAVYDSQDSGKRSVGADYALIVRELDILGNDFAYDPNTQTAYVSVPYFSAINPNTVTPVAVPSGVIGTPYPVGAEPDSIVVSDDGSKVYLSVDFARVIRRIDVPSGVTDLQFALGVSSCGDDLLPDDMFVVRGAPESIVISRFDSGCNPLDAGIAVYDDGVMRPQTTQAGLGTGEIAPSDVITSFFGYDNLASTRSFRHFSMDAQGVHEESVTVGLIDTLFEEMAFHDGLVYVTNGQVIDPSDDSEVGSYGIGGPIAMDAATNRVFIARQGWLYIFDRESFVQLDRVFMPGAPGHDKLVYIGDNQFLMKGSGSTLYVLELVELSRNFLPVVHQRYCGSPIRDDFANPDSGWPVGDSGNVLFRYIDGEYNIFHRNENWWAAVTRGDVWNDSQLFSARGRIAERNGTWGLLFGLNSDWSSFYTFEVWPAERLWVIFHFNSTAGWSVVDSGISGFIQPGDSWNTLALHHVGVNQQMRVNDQTVSFIQKKVGRIGFTGTSFEPNTDIRFDDYFFADINCPLALPAGVERPAAETFTLERPSPSLWLSVADE